MIFIYAVYIKGFGGAYIPMGVQFAITSKFFMLSPPYKEDWVSLRKSAVPRISTKHKFRIRNF